MKRLSLSLAATLASLWGGGTMAWSQDEIPQNPLRSRRPVAAAPAVPTPAEAVSAEPSAVPAPEVPSAVVDDQVAPARFAAPEGVQEIQPAGYQGRRVAPGQRSVRRIARRPRPTAGSPFQLLQFGVRAPSHEVRGYQPAHLRSRDSVMVMQEGGVPEPVPTGEIVEEEYFGGSMMEGGADCCGGVGCDQCGGIQCPSLRNFEFFAGTHGFTGAPNLGETASFGFDYGFNWGAPLWCLANGEIGVQAGFRHIGSNYDGASFTNSTRNQYFITAGIFRRVDYGLQGGVVFDYLGESWYYNADITQIRGEVSWMFPECHEVGYWFTANLNGDSITVNPNAVVPVTLTGALTVDQHRFFYRRRFEDSGAEGRFSAGFTSAGDGLLGADFQLPISDSWALESTFTYVIPRGDAASNAFADEAWNVAFGLVWYPGMRKARGRDYFRPLFDVGDNGSMILARP